MMSKMLKKYFEFSQEDNLNCVVWSMKELKDVDNLTVNEWQASLLCYVKNGIEKMSE